MAFFDLFNHNFKLFLPELFILLTGIFILFLGAFIINIRRYKYPYLVKELHYLIIFIFTISFFLLVNNPIRNFIIFNNLLIIDDFSSSIKGIVLLATIGCLLISFDYLEKEGFNMFEYNLLILFSIFGILCFISSYDLVSLYLALEVQSLSFYILATLKRDSGFSTEAGLKYFILGALSSGFLLFGISLVYGLTGTTNFESLTKIVLNFDLYESIGNFSALTFSFSDRLVLGLLFIMFGLFFKLSAAPFHMWSPDVYEGSPTSVTILFAVVPKIGLFVVFSRLLFFTFYDLIGVWQNVLIIVSLLSIMIGTFGALRQYRIKRFLAFSSITHVGYLLIAFSTGTFEGLGALFFYLVIYIVMSLNIWAIVILLEIRKKKNIRLKYLTDLQNLSRNNPVLSLTLLVNLFSMAGVPPLAGFYAKVYVFFSAIEISLNILVIIGILLSVISAFYYIRFIKIIYFDNSSQSLFLTQNIDLKKAYLLGITFYFILFLFVRPDPLLLFVERIGLSLFV
jgi:NADH-quinone oxidoreductase subunit N|tara:strand:- start:162 stop:1691 length:1530 start_codon:yes stop_codon:yes gene_type:complete